MCATTPAGNDDSSGEIYNRLDFSAISFPSDRLTIQTLRRLYPNLFDQGLERKGELQPHFFSLTAPQSRQAFEPGVTMLESMLFAERLVAAFAYGRARGWPDPENWEGEIGLQGFKEDLARFYETLQLASGPQAAAELIRNFEAEARSLATDIQR